MEGTVTQSGIDTVICNPYGVLYQSLIYQTADQGITIFVTTHYMDEAEYCDRISMMVDGHIRALDTPDGLKHRFNARDMDEVFQKLAREAQRGEHAFTHTQTEQP